MGQTYVLLTKWEYVLRHIKLIRVEITFLPENRFAGHKLSLKKKKKKKLMMMSLLIHNSLNVLGIKAFFFNKLRLTGLTPYLF